MKNQKGYTIMELIIVIVMLAALTGYAITKYSDLSHLARAAVVSASVPAVGSAMRIAMGHIGDGSFPNATQVLDNLTLSQMSNDTSDNNLTIWHEETISNTTCKVVYSPTDENVTPTIIASSC